MSSFYVFNAGCIRRAMDMIQVQKYLIENGWTMTRRIGRADMIVVATCGVVKLNEINSLRAVARAAGERKPDAKIVVSGCLPKINPAEIEAIGDFTMVPSGQLHELDAVIKPGKPFSQVGLPDSAKDNRDIMNYLVARSYCRRSPLYKSLFDRYGMNGTFLAASVTLNKTIDSVRNAVTGRQKRKVIPYFNIKIADGCLSNCAFCATKFATGKLRSRPPEQIIEDFCEGLDKGYKVFQLIAEDTGAYGKDIGINFTELLRRMFRIDNDYQLVIIDCCPQWLVEQRDELVPLLVENQTRVKEIFIPIQSGSNSVLRSMKRSYTPAAVKSVLKELQEKAAGIALRTSFLVGFPGETENDYGETKRFVGDMSFAEVTINRYEDRPGTLASTMAEKVPQEIVELRARTMAQELNCRILS